MRHIRSLLVAVAATLVCAAPAGAAPTPAPPEYYGANIQALIRQGFVKPGGWPAYLRTMSSSGLSIARFDAPWMWAQPKSADQPYDWGLMDQVAAALASQSIRWLPVIDLPPAWARSADGSRLAPENYPLFAAFAHAFVARYGPGGAFWAAHPELTQLPPVTYEVWTEANSAHFWEANPDPAAYLTLFKPVREAIKSADGGASVLVSLGWQDFEAFTRGLYAAGLKGASDGVAFHPYAPTAEGVVTLTRRLRAIMAANGEADLPIQLTEIGWPKAPDGTGSWRAYYGPVSDRSRAATMALTGDALAASDCNVKSYIVYSLVEEEKDPANIEDWLGLFDRDGSPTPSSDAISQATSRWTQASARYTAASRSGPRAGAPPLLPLCNGGDPDLAVASEPIQPPSALPLQLNVPARPDRCFMASVNYFGDPLEDASVFIRSYRGKQTAISTAADGQGQMCMSASSRAKPFLTWSRVGAMASSPVYYCTHGNCQTFSCAKAQVRLKPRRMSRRKLKMTLAVRCGGRTMFGEPVTIDALDHEGLRHYLGAFFTGTRQHRLTYEIDPKRDRRIRVAFKGDSTFQLAPVVRVLRMPKLRKR